MEENKSLSFDQLPSAVGELLTKVNTMMTRLDDIGQRIGNECVGCALKSFNMQLCHTSEVKFSSFGFRL